MQISFNMYFTAALGLLALLLGKFMRKKIGFLEKFCIPAPVAGGLVFALVSLILYETGVCEIVFDETLKNILMMVFFTCIGFQADLQTVKKGGVQLLIFLLLTAGMIVLQNAAALGASKLLGFSPLLAMCTGSIPMVGGHGTAAAFGPQLEAMGFSGATTYATAAATFGLIAGSLLGGPLAKSVIRRKKLAEEGEGRIIAKKAEEEHKETFLQFRRACYEIILAMGIGALISYLIELAGVTVPAYIGSMIAAAVMRNVTEKNEKFRAPMDEIGQISDVSLAVFLGIAMITLRLWELAALALPLIILLVLQVIIMFVYARFVIFNAMGRDYDAAVITSGFCGFGLGATPNALANMETVCKKYRYSEKAFMIVPLVGALFVDFINAAVLTVILNLLK